MDFDFLSLEISAVAPGQSRKNALVPALEVLGYYHDAPHGARTVFAPYHDVR